MPYVPQPEWANEVLGTSQQMADFVKGLRIRNAVGEVEFERLLRVAEAKDAAKKDLIDTPPARHP